MRKFNYIKIILPVFIFAALVVLLYVTFSRNSISPPTLSSKKEIVVHLSCDDLIAFYGSKEKASRALLNYIENEDDVVAIAAITAAIINQDKIEFFNKKNNIKKLKDKVTDLNRVYKENNIPKRIEVFKSEKGKWGYEISVRRRRVNQSS